MTCSIEKTNASAPLKTEIMPPQHYANIYIMKAILSEYMMRLFDHPTVFGKYLQIGTYQNHPVYVGDNPPKDWVAMATSDWKGICINEIAFAALKKSPHFTVFLENICEHELSNGPVHDHDGERTEMENIVIQYLRHQLVLK
jgi:hypothetical protein